MANIPFLNNAYFAGTVGIGTESPLKKLSISGGDVAVNNGNSFIVGAAITGNTQIGELGADAGQLQLLTESTRDIKFGSTTYGNIMFLEGSNGNVGIGETSPDRMLHVNSGTNNANTIFESTDTAVTVRFKDLTGSAQLECRNDFRFLNNAGADQRMVISAAGAIKFNNYGAGTLVTDASGNITASPGGGSTNPGPWLPLAGGTMTGNINFNDDVYARFGNGNDLDIGHDASNSRITHNGVGNLIIQNTEDNSDIIFQSDDGSGGVATYFKVDPASQATTFLKRIYLPDDVKAQFGNSSDLKIYHDGSNSYIEDTGSGDLILTSNASSVQINKSTGVNLAKFIVDGSVELYFNSSKKFETTSAGINITGGWVTNGVSVATANVEHTDNVKSLFGNGNDLQIFHDGSNSYIIDNGTGTFNLRGSTQVIIGGKNGEVGIQYVENAGVGLRHNNVTKLITESTGVTITGAATATTFSGDLNGTINTATTAVTQVNAVDNETVATTAYVNNKIQLIPAGLVFQGTWDARTAAEGGAAGDRGNPALANGVGTTGNFYIVSNSGSVNLDGITDWKVGDWAVFIEQGASDQWEKIDNSSVLDGVGTGQTLPLWSGSGTSNTLTDSRFSQTSTQNIITGPGTAGSDLSINVKNSAGQVAIQALGTGEVVIPSNYLFVSSSQGAYIAGILRARGGVTDDGGTLNLGGNGLTTNLTLTSNTKATFAGDVFIKSAALSNQENTDVDTGTETVGEVSTADFTAAFFDFVVKKTTNVRSGTVYACHDGTNVQFTETSTQDLGNTSDVVLSVDISGGSMRLRATVASDDWSIKSLIRGI